MGTPASATPAAGAATAWSPAHTLADIVTRWAGASAVMQRHRLDFCCRGERSLETACREAGLDVRRVLEELQRELRPVAADADWRQRGTAELIGHLVDHFHAWHRRELPRLREMAAKVERVHSLREEAPRGLATFLAGLQQRLELHMQKEEQVLFPAVAAGARAAAEAALQELAAEHQEHGHGLAALRTLTHGLVAPADACGTWRALYGDLLAFERALMEHVHLENHVLFPRVHAG